MSAGNAIAIDGAIVTVDDEFMAKYRADETTRIHFARGYRWQKAERERAATETHAAYLQGVKAAQS